MTRPVPQDLDSERALIGAAMIGGPAVVDEAMPLIRSEMFFLADHRAIWDALVATHERGEPMDILALENELRRQDRLATCGGQSYLIDLAESFGDTANTAFYAKMVREHFQRRSLISLGIKLANDARDLVRSPEDVACAFVDQAEKLVTRDDQEETDIADLLRRLPEYLAEQSSSFVKTGLEHFDSNFTGLERGSVTVIAARPSVGKTALALFFCINAAVKQKIPSAFFSVEMTVKGITTRVAAFLGERSMGDLRRQCTPEDLRHYAEVSIGRLGGTTIFVHAQLDNVQDIVATARRHIRRDGIGLVVVDYLQLCKPAERCENNNLAVASMSSAFKRLAIQNDVAVVVLSQLRRGNEDRPPVLSDLRDSGAIEQDGDTVILLHREDDTGAASVDLTLHVAKNRQGPTGQFMVAFDRPRMGFKSFQREASEA